RIGIVVDQDVDRYVSAKLHNLLGRQLWHDLVKLDDGLADLVPQGAEVGDKITRLEFVVSCFAHVSSPWLITPPPRSSCFLSAHAALKVPASPCTPRARSAAAR